MKVKKIKDFKWWWIIWDFTPSLIENNKLFEVWIKEYKKWDKDKKHYHKIATEYTIINCWKFLMNWKELNKWNIVIIEPNQEAEFKCLEDWNITVIKTPSIPNDKYLV